MIDPNRIRDPMCDGLCTCCGEECTSDGSVWMDLGENPRIEFRVCGICLYDALNLTDVTDELRDLLEDPDQ